MNPTTDTASNIATLLEKGYQYQSQGKLQQATEQYRQVIFLAPTHAQAYNNLGCIQVKLNNHAQAKLCFQKAIAFNPEYSDAHNNLGNILLHEYKINQAEQHFKQAIVLNNKFADAYNNLARLYHKNNNLDKSQQLFQQALALDSDNPNILNNFACLLQADNKLDSAIDYLKKILAKHPDYYGAHYNLAKCLMDQQQPLAAIQHLNLVIESTSIQHDTKLYCKALSELIFCLCETCSWKNNQELIRNLIEQTNKLWEQGISSELDPFSIQALCNDDAVFKHQVSADYARENLKLVAHKPVFTHIKATADILKIGYLSPDFCQHPIGLLIRDLFKYHDRTKFHITGYNLANNPPGKITNLIQQSCDSFVNLYNYHDHKAERIFADRIDILIDLAGYTSKAEPTILASQPAKVQCHWLGFTSSLQAHFIQYFIASKTMLPQATSKYFSEKILYVDDPYCATAPFLEPIPHLNRADYQIPEDVFIFCCFEATYRICENVFAMWMQILKLCPNSILWLYKGNPAAQKNLQVYAREYNINPDRLVFLDNNMLTPNWPHQLADVWLDTIKLSSGTGIFLATWLGLPVIALSGPEAPCRHAAGLLTGAKLTHLIAHSKQEYIQKAIELYTRRQYLSTMKSELYQQRYQNPLFDQAALINKLEKLYLSLA